MISSGVTSGMSDGLTPRSLRAPSVEMLRNPDQRPRERDGNDAHGTRNPGRNAFGVVRGQSLQQLANDE